MEGSTLTAEQTRQIYETNSFLPESGEQIHVDDVIETRNHFRAFSYLLDHVDEPITDNLVWKLHALLKKGTSQENNPHFSVGAYKTRENEIGKILGITSLPTVAAAKVPHMMRLVFDEYQQLTDSPVHIALCHWMFERVHPFGDGNGRIGRLLMFKECLRLNTVPPLVRDEHRNLYIKGLIEFPTQPGWLVDLLLSERDFYEYTFIQQMGQGQIQYKYVEQWSEQDSSIWLEEAENFTRLLAHAVPSPTQGEDSLFHYRSSAPRKHTR